MLSVKQGGNKYHFLNLSYDSTWDWTPVSRAIGEHSTINPIVKLNNYLLSQLVFYKNILGKLLYSIYQKHFHKILTESIR